MHRRIMRPAAATFAFKEGEGAAGDAILLNRWSDMMWGYRIYYYAKAMHFFRLFHPAKQKKS